jgi:hypothetical protein
MVNQRRWRLLAEHVVARRLELGYTSATQFAHVAGISRPIISDLEAGKRSSYSIQTLVKLQLALGWAPGSISDILSGGRPTPIDRSA